MKFFPKGTQLLELMITLSILAILVGIAFPIYSQHQERALRLQAEVALVKLASALENYYLQHNTYENANFTNLQLAENIQGYQLKINLAAPDNYLISAIPLKKNPETSCSTLSLNSNGDKICWDT